MEMTPELTAELERQLKKQQDAADAAEKLNAEREALMTSFTSRIKKNAVDGRSAIETKKARAAAESRKKRRYLWTVLAQERYMV